jgi:DNA integrity scanning protein DisA with diadenylate cyclase activity
MKKIFKGFSTLYTWVLEFFLGSIIISILIHFAIKIYQFKWGSGIISIFVSLLLILPIAPMIRIIYSPVLSRLLSFVYIVMFIYLVVYTITIAVQHGQNKKITEDLNALIKEKKLRK